jgi:LacI family transcriptional regulator
MAVRLKDVAQALNLSISTVSAVLHNRVDFSEATRQRVLQKVKELHYRPNHVARSLVTRKTNVVGLVVPNLGLAFPIGSLLKGIDAITHPAGYRLVVFNTDDDPVREDEGVAALISNQVDGLIIASSHNRTENRIWKPIRESGIPFVLIDRFFPSVPFVGADNERIGFMATRHLIQRGYRTVALLTRSRHVMTRFGRYRGYLRALREAGFRVHRDHILEVNYKTEASGYVGAMQLLNLRLRPDAIFAINDLLALDAMRAARESGLRVPEDFGVVGVGNLPYGEHLRIPLSSVEGNPTQVGKSAASMLLGMIDGKPAPGKPVLIEPTLIVRESSCRVP